LEPGGFKLWVNCIQLGQLDCTAPPSTVTGRNAVASTADMAVLTGP
jgi:hypothetical protein